ncbi:MAG: biotin-dependent carboxyltransferase family protein [Candidatus Limnocylindria bacterium]
MSSPLAAVEVLEPGLLTTVQDATGRPAWRRYGVPVSGAADPFSARLANRLVGNPDDAALLEITLLGPTLRFAAPVAIALAGADLGASLDQRPLHPRVAVRTDAGTTLRFSGSDRGARSYLAFGGGVDVPVVLGSRATDLRSGFGGFDGRALRAGDRLLLGSSGGMPLLRARTPLDRDGAIRVLAGPHPNRFATDALDRLSATAWTVSPAADRAGVRLEGEPIRHASRDAAEVAPMGLPLGAIQVPPDGQPIVMLADRPVTGGYAVLACVARADIGRVAQLVTGDVVRFGLVTPHAALAALRDRDAALAALAAVASDPADSAWAGSLE